MLLFGVLRSSMKATSPLGDDSPAVQQASGDDASKRENSQAFVGASPPKNH